MRLNRCVAHEEQRGTSSDSGASLVEYALLLALVVVVCISAMAFFGDSVFGSLDRAGSSITSAGP